jgi:DNA invertase Pin-like site-specific DNA recombinase
MTQHRNRIRNKTKVALYIRVSSEEQVLHGYSLDAQREALIEYAEKHDMEVVDIYVDEGKTARKELKKRTEIFRLIDDIEKGDKGIEMILFIKIDRWFRNVGDYHYVQRILEKHDVTWKATQEEYNTDTSDGRMKVNIMLSVAENEADRTSERIKFVNESKIRKGQAIVGSQNLPRWLVVKEIDGIKRVVLDPENAEIMREYIKHFKTHNSKRLAVLHCNQKFDKAYGYEQYNAVFKNPLVYGCYRDVENYCEALITKEEYEELQRLGERHVKVNPVKRVYKFAGLVRCPTCGRRSKGTAKKRVTKTYQYYTCGATVRDKLCTDYSAVGEEKLEKYLLDNLNDLITDYIVNFESHGDIKQDDVKLKKEIEELEDELSRVNYRFQKKRMDYEEYDIECDRIEKSLAKLKLELKNDKRDNSQLIEFVNSDWQTVYHTLNDENKRALWRSVIKTIVKTGKNSYDIEFY